MNLPGFLCIGAQKAGTSWLNVQLGRHPELWLPPVKELHFFDHLYVPENREWTSAHLHKGLDSAIRTHLEKKAVPDWGYLRYLTDQADRKLFTENWYARCFDRPRAKTRLCGDITPEYCTVPQAGIDHIKRLLPGVKLIYIIRDPVERALSQLRMNVERRGSEPTLQQLMKMADDPDIENRGDYKSYIPRWKQSFDSSRLLFLPYGDIRTAPKQLLTQIETFLGVGHADKYKPDERIHETRKFLIPNPVKELFEARYESQRQFLKHEFGESFFARTH